MESENQYYRELSELCQTFRSQLKAKLRYAHLNQWDEEERRELQYQLRITAHDLLFESNDIQERLPIANYGKARIEVDREKDEDYRHYH